MKFKIKNLKFKIRADSGQAGMTLNGGNGQLHPGFGEIELLLDKSIDYGESTAQCYSQ